MAFVKPVSAAKLAFKRAHSEARLARRGGQDVFVHSPLTTPKEGRIYDIHQQRQIVKQQKQRAREEIRRNNPTSVDTKRQRQLESTFNNPRERYKLERRQQRIQQKYGNSATEREIRDAHLTGPTRPQPNPNDPHIEQSRRLAEAHRQTTARQNQVDFYKQQKKIANNGSGSFWFNGRTRQLTDEGVATVKADGTLTSPVTGRKPSASPTQTGRPSGGDPVVSKRLNLGDAIGDGSLTSQFNGTLKMAGENLRGEYQKVGAGQFFGGAAIRGAVWGAGIGGTISASQGGDFWAGAKEGAFKGAVGYTGLKSLRAATKSEKYGDILENGKAIWAHHGKAGVSNSVNRIAQVNRDANNVLK